MLASGSDELKDCVVGILQSSVFSSFAALSYPLLFIFSGNLSKMMMGITENDVDQFILATEDKSNVRKLSKIRHEIENEL